MCRFAQREEMRLEEEIFKNMFADRKALSAYGFKRKKDGMVLERKIADGDYLAEVSVDRNGKVKGRVIDLDLGEEYLPVHIESYTGSFIGKIREEYSGLLRDIREKCFDEMAFDCAQTNRMADLILERYSEKCDHPFSTAPDYAVFRYPENRKWYALVMNIKRGLIEKNDSEEMIEVVNLKADSEKMDEILSVSGIYPGYHMNRANWISVVLDESVDDELLMQLIDDSRNFALSKGGARPKGKKNWIVPANPKYFDLDAAFEKNDEILWKQSSNVKRGDVVFLYVTSPVKAVRYRCEVLEADISYDYKDSNVSMKHVMKIKKTAEYPPDFLTFSKLSDYGIKAVRGPRFAPDEFVRDAEKFRSVKD